MQIGLTVTGYARLYTSIGTTGGASAYALYLYLGFIIYAWCPSYCPCILHRGSLPHKGGLCLSIYISQANMTWDTLRRPGQAKPRRSKGCRTCLRRKVKCGELLPNREVILLHTWIFYSTQQFQTNVQYR